jgi:hypothetical protein
MSGIVPDAAVILPKNNHPVMSMPPGPKNKGGCPPDLHLKLPEDVRHHIDRCGPGRYQDKIVDIIRAHSKKRSKQTLIEIQSDLVRLKRQLELIRNEYSGLLKRFQSEYGLSPDEYNQMVDQIEYEATLD